MKLVYVVCDEPEGPYARMARLAAWSARRAMPQCEIEMLVPQQDVKHHSGTATGQVIDRLVGVDCGALDRLGQSRFIKTTMRRFVAGDFVYLDSDTLVLRDFRDVWDGVTDVGLAEDLNCGKRVPGFPAEQRELFAALGWETTRLYFNGGMMAARDNVRVAELFECWHRFWLLGKERQRCAMDQPSLNHSISESGVKVRRLSYAYNALIDANPRLARGACVLHFFTKGGRPRGETIAAQLLAAYEATGDVPWHLLDQCRREGHACAVPSAPWKLWQSGAYSAAVREKVRQMCSRWR
jgi:hypothetical protein